MNECQPMVALESLAAGVPCIINDTSTILEELLVCPQQDAPDRIQECINRVIPRLGDLLSASVREHVQRLNVELAGGF
jgi:glycosyltransferase involved in cell wall biosynthesis